MPAGAWSESSCSWGAIPPTTSPGGKAPPSPVTGSPWRSSFSLCRCWARYGAPASSVGSAARGRSYLKSASAGLDSLFLTHSYAILLSCFE